jgi:hypothetical protein
VKLSYRPLAIFSTTAVLLGGSTFAQTPHSVRAPAPFVDRGAEKSQMAEEARRKKWSSCKKQARVQKTKLRGWNRFINDCMAR